MAVQTEIHERNAKRRTTERGRRAVAAATADALDERDERLEAEPLAPRAMPRIVSVYRGAAAGEFRHARCHRELVFVGVRGGIEIDFYCLGCREHITLTEAALARVPVGRM